MQTEERYVYADSGKNFQTLIHVERLPYTWGDIRNGRLGINMEDEEVKQSKLFSKKDKQFLAPCLIPYFE